MSSNTEDRRSVLVRLVVAATALITGALTGLVALVASPTATAETKRWRRLIAVDDVPEDGPIQAVLAERHADGWHQTRRQSVVFVDREADGFRALSATCSHLGCRVRWDVGTTQFHCPCHGGVYDREGAVVSGPPPAPLARLAVRVNPETSDLEVEL